MFVDPVDVSRIKSNPFAFKDTVAEADAALESQLRIVARFFENEIASEDGFYAAWNGYQGAKGDAAIVELVFSLDHVSRYRETVPSAEGILAVLHIGLLELVEGGGPPPPFPDWARGRLKRKEADATVPISDFLDEQGKLYREKYGATRCLERALRRGSEADRLRLMKAFAFSKDYRLGTAPSRPRHLHCAAGEKDDLQAEKEGRRQRFFVRKYCTRFCKPPTREELDKFFPKLVRRLYAMRSALVHRASPVIIAASGRDGVPGTLIDALFMGSHLVSYETTLTADELIAVFRRCIWACMCPPILDTQENGCSSSNRAS